MVRRQYHLQSVGEDIALQIDPGRLLPRQGQYPGQCDHTQAGKVLPAELRHRSGPLDGVEESGLGEPFGEVPAEPIDAELRESVGYGGIVDGPGNQLGSHTMNSVDELRID